MKGPEDINWSKQSKSAQKFHEKELKKYGQKSAKSEALKRKKDRPHTNCTKCDSYAHGTSQHKSHPFD